MLGDMVAKDDKARVKTTGLAPRAVMNLEMMGRHPDSDEPKWQNMPQMQSSAFHKHMARGNLETFQVWDAPERNEKWPPEFFREPLRARRYVSGLSQIPRLFTAPL